MKTQEPVGRGCEQGRSGSEITKDTVATGRYSGGLGEAPRGFTPQRRVSSSECWLPPPPGALLSVDSPARNAAGTSMAERLGEAGGSAGRVGTHRREATRASGVLLPAGVLTCRTSPRPGPRTGITKLSPGPVFRVPPTLLPGGGSRRTAKGGEGSRGGVCRRPVCWPREPACRVEGGFAGLSASGHSSRIHAVHPSGMFSALPEVRFRQWSPVRLAENAGRPLSSLCAAWGPTLQISPRRACARTEGCAVFPEKPCATYQCLLGREPSSGTTSPPQEATLLGRISSSQRSRGWKHSVEHLRSWEIKDKDGVRF